MSFVILTKAQFDQIPQDFQVDFTVSQQFRQAVVGSVENYSVIEFLLSLQLIDIEWVNLNQRRTHSFGLILGIYKSKEDYIGVELCTKKDFIEYWLLHGQSHQIFVVASVFS